MFWRALASGFVNILVHLNNKRIILKPQDSFFLKSKIFEINRTFIWPLSFKIIDIL